MVHGDPDLLHPALGQLQGHLRSRLGGGVRPWRGSHTWGTRRNADPQNKGGKWGRLGKMCFVLGHQGALSRGAGQQRRRSAGDVGVTGGGESRYAPLRSAPCRLLGQDACAAAFKSPRRRCRTSEGRAALSRDGPSQEEGGGGLAGGPCRCASAARRSSCPGPGQPGWGTGGLPRELLSRRRRKGARRPVTLVPCSPHQLDAGKGTRSSAFLTDQAEPS